MPVIISLNIDYGGKSIAKGKILKRMILIILITIIAIGALIGFVIEPNRLGVKTYNIKQPKLKGTKIVFVSDFHVSPFQKSRLIRVVKLVNKQKPDLVLSTGDFVYGYKTSDTLPITQIAEELSKVKSKYGFYAVLGNHDWMQGGKTIENALEAKGIKILGNENVVVDLGEKKLHLAGVEDLTTRNIDLVKALNNVSSPSIMLTHSPDVFPFITKDENKKLTDVVDLTLAGHTHGGQVVAPFFGPLIVPSDYGKKYASGLIKENGKYMIVTKGIGTSILPVRFNCKPEIIVINFI